MWKKFIEGFKIDTDISKNAEVVLDAAIQIVAALQPQNLNIQLITKQINTLQETAAAGKLIPERAFLRFAKESIQGQTLLKLCQPLTTTTPTDIVLSYQGLLDFIPVLENYQVLTDPKRSASLQEDIAQITAAIQLYPYTLQEKFSLPAHILDETLRKTLAEQLKSAITAGDITAQAIRSNKTYIFSFTENATDDDKTTLLASVKNIYRKAGKVNPEKAKEFQQVIETLETNSQNADTLQKKPELIYRGLEVNKSLILDIIKKYFPAQATIQSCLNAQLPLTLYFNGLENKISTLSDIETYQQHVIQTMLLGPLENYKIAILDQNVTDQTPAGEKLRTQQVEILETMEKLTKDLIEELTATQKISDAPETKASYTVPKATETKKPTLEPLRTVLPETTMSSEKTTELAITPQTVLSATITLDMLRALISTINGTINPSIPARDKAAIQNVTMAIVAVARFAEIAKPEEKEVLRQEIRRLNGRKIKIKNDDPLVRSCLLDALDNPGSADVLKAQKELSGDIAKNQAIPPKRAVKTKSIKQKEMGMTIPSEGERNMNTKMLPLAEVKQQKRRSFSLGAILGLAVGILGGTLGLSHLMPWTMFKPTELTLNLQDLVDEARAKLDQVIDAQDKPRTAKDQEKDKIIQGLRDELPNSVEDDAVKALEDHYQARLQALEAQAPLPLAEESVAMAAPVQDPAAARAEADKAAADKAAADRAAAIERERVAGWRSCRTELDAWKKLYTEIYESQDLAQGKPFQADLDKFLANKPADYVLRDTLTLKEYQEKLVFLKKQKVEAERLKKLLMPEAGKTE